MEKEFNICRISELSESDNRKLIYTGISVAALLAAAGMPELNGWILSAAITNLVVAMIKATTIDFNQIKEEE